MLLRHDPSAHGFLEAYEQALRGERGCRINTRRGSMLDHLGGSAAILWAAEARRDRDEFDQIFISTASGQALERWGKRLYDGAERITDRPGEGKATFARTTAGKEGAIHTGTRIVVQKDGGEAELYAVSTDTPVLAQDLSVEAPIRATRTGKGVAVVAKADALRIGDLLFDPELVPVALHCLDGTTQESPSAYVARARAELARKRVGYPERIRQACMDAGAAHVVLLDAGAFGEPSDFGVSHVHVADVQFQSPPELLDACFVALEDARVAGCDLQVLGMQRVPVSMHVSAVLSDKPHRFNLIDLRTGIVRALVDVFNGRAASWLFDIDELAGVACTVARGAIRSAAMTTTPPPPSARFYPVLPLYTLIGTCIDITFHAPSD